MSVPSTSAVPRRLMPLHVTLAVVFVSLFVIFGLAVTWFGHTENREMVLLGAEDLTKRIAAQLRTTISGLYLPAHGLVDLASKSLDPGAETPEARLAWLDPMAEALRQNPSLTSIFVGFEDGDFFQVRSLMGREKTARSLGAPEDATLAVIDLERGPDETVASQLLFYDHGHSVLGKTVFQGAFDPRTREWYRLAVGTSEAVTTDFYVFLVSGELGLTFSRRFSRGHAVVGADLAMSDISASLRSQLPTPNTRILIFDDGQQLIASSEPELLAGFEDRRPRLDELGSTLYEVLGERLIGDRRDARFELEHEDRSWLVATSPMPTRSGFGVTLATMIPRDELLAPVDRIRNQSLLISLGLLLLAVIAVLWVSHNVSGSLRGLAVEASEIRRFRFSTPMKVKSRIAEVDELASTMAVMKTTLEQSFAISRALSTEKDPRRLLEMILREARKIANAEGGAILMASEDSQSLEVAILEHERSGIHVGGTSEAEPRSFPVPLAQDADPSSADLAAIRAGRTLVFDDLDAIGDLDASVLRERFQQGGSRVRALMAVPLIDQQGGVVGLLQLVDPRPTGGIDIAFDQEVVPAIEALAADAAVALDLRRLLRAQKELLNSLIHLLAAAIDAKSPYTHGHCQRVPEIALLLARAAHDATDGPLVDFHLEDDEWDELYIASWLHDCGKVTTPEYVVDKATRLETLHNRIHEIRTRFEILWRDAEIEYLRAVASGRSEVEAHADLENKQEALRGDWAFVAESNLGETFMVDDRVEKLRRIGSRTWLRHFDDRLGLSHEELSQRSKEPAPTIPAPERLLVDALHHVVPRPDPERPFGDNPHGFRMPVPTSLYNHGEIYNLSIRRGTLTEEERFKINEHIVQTIEMLSRLPFPRELTRVPEWAGNHHEKLDGTGYPRRLDVHQLSIPARIMAVADVFEALTAADRPYMRPKTLGKALSIMASMCEAGHLDPDIFEVLLTSGVYAEYGRQHLRADQLDAVDIQALLRST